MEPRRVDDHVEPFQLADVLGVSTPVDVLPLLHVAEQPRLVESNEPIELDIKGVPVPWVDDHPLPAEEDVVLEVQPRLLDEVGDERRARPPSADRPPLVLLA